MCTFVQCLHFALGTLKINYEIKKLMKNPGLDISEFFSAKNYFGVKNPKS